MDLKDPASIYRAVCDSMTCGVMLIDAQGRIETFNPAASALLGLDRDAVLHRSFAEVFFVDEAFDELNEAVLAAIHEGVVGHQRVATVRVAGRAVPLAVDTSYLRKLSGEAENGRRGVVAVFSDISELESLRAKEIALAKDVEAKHLELQGAFRSLEERNLELNGLLRKVRAVRLMASACGIVFAAGLGVWLWDGSSASLFGAPSTQAAKAPGDVRLLTVEPRRIASTITVASAIDPLREIAVASPVDGKVGTVHVTLGESVGAGQPLLTLDVGEVRVQRRKAQAAWLKAEAQMRTLADWPNGSEASKAKRAVTKARIALEASNTKIVETTFLVDQGLAPAARKGAAEREHRTRVLDLESAEQDLSAVLVKGRENREVARLELENARSDLERIDGILRNASVIAPVAGVVLRIGEGTGSRGDGLTTGSKVEAGAHLVTIGDMQGIKASGLVDEVDVRRIRPGHAVRISGPAFPGIVLEGRVVRVSSRAFRPPGQRNLPVFRIAAAVDRLDEEQRKAVRLGMSADMEIVVYENERALVVPVGAVDLSQGIPRVRVRDEKTGEERIVQVATGITTLDSVEVLSGLAQGDRVVMP